MESAVEVLKRALRELNASVDADPLRPQAVSRQLGLDKNLTWKFMRIVRSDDAAEALSLLPGPSGADIYLRAFEKSGAPAKVIAKVRAAFEAVSSLTSTRIGGRHELGTVLDGLRRDGQLEQSRRVAFRGLSGVFGVQAKLRLTTQIIAPPLENQASSVYNLFLIVGLIGLRRNRPVAGLPLFRFASVSSDVASATDLKMHPLVSDPTVDPSRAWILQEFTTIASDAVHARAGAGSHLLELGHGAIGSAGSGDVCFGAKIDGALNTRRTPGDTRLEFATAVRVPSESVVTDLFVPNALADAQRSSCEVYGLLSGSLPQSVEDRKQVQLPIASCIEFLPVDESALAIAEFARYGELVLMAFAQAGLEPRDFQCLRVRIDYPPCPAEVMVGWDMSE